MLLIGAGLLLKSFVGLTAVDPGFRTSRVVAADIVLPDSRYRLSAARREFYASLIDRVRALPGVEAAGAVSVLPMSPLGNDFDLTFTIDGLAATSPSERPRAAYRGVLSGYFEAIGMTIRKGRSFDDFDGRENGPRVAIVNETLARRYFSGVDPIDRVVKMPMAGDLRIVGVVADARTDGLQAAPEAEVFVPYYQLAIAEMQVVVLTDLDAGEAGKRIRTAMAGIDPALPIAKVSAIENLLAESVAQPRFNMALLVGLAICAAALAAVGVYGVVAYSVSRRTSEIGLRMALGADAGSTFALIVRNTMKVVTAGIVLGLVGAAAMGRSLESLLFGVSFLDASTYAAAGFAVAALAALAASLPALRAARIDPVTALRVG
jgi:putative ABC transport system permease protein